ncbi:MAG: L-threonylcarbamoyladenylate synthase [Rickettsiales bacterium]|nr:L-threonylcarbamoyladenylate synthase [Rickettsiales bacterium]
MLIIKESDAQAVEIACQFLQADKVISFACDTVYGLAVDASSQKAVENLYNLKKRDSKKPVAIFVKDISTAKKIFVFDKKAKEIAQKFLPGMLTLVLKKKVQNRIKLAQNLNLQHEDFLGFRIIDHDFVTKLVSAFDGILAVTSANLSGQEAALQAAEVKKYFADSNLDLIIDGGTLMPQKISTVVKIDNGKIEILRRGAIDYKNLL